MEISLDTTGPLERRLKVEVPEQRIAEEVRSRLQRLSRNTRIDGFRPGHVPLKVVERRFGGQVRQEVLGEVLRESFHEALHQQNLRPAGEPQIDPLQTEPGSGLSYTATFEVYPEISLEFLEGVEIERPVCEIQDADVDRMIENLREQRREWREVDRAARDGDQLRITFKGTVDGEPFEGGTQEDFNIELGQGRLLEGFEEGLVGARAGDTRTLDLRFPEGYPRSELAGKPVRFDVTVWAVSEPELPALDDAFFANFGVEEGGLEAFRAEVRRNMERELEQALRNRLKQNVMDALSSARDFELPEALVTGEQQRLMQEMRQRLAYAGAPEGQADQLQPELFEGEARRRVSLGLLVGEIVRANDLQADATKVRQRIETMAAGYDDPQAVVKWHYDNPDHLRGVEAAVVEDEAVDWVLQRARITEREYSFDDLMNPGQTGESTEDEG